MNKIKITIISFLLIFAGTIFLTGCGKEISEIKNITGISFEDTSFEYDGTEKEILITGNLPQGAEAVYQNNKATNIGEYLSTVVITAEGYNELTLTATLTILGRQFSDISFENQNYYYDGEEKTIEVSGILPEGSSVIYSNNKASEIGEYNATATISANGYETLVLHADLTILAREFTGITFDNISYSYDGNPKTIEINGSLPAGSTVSYTNNLGVDAGEYNATATISAVGYKTIILQATLIIEKIDIVGVSFSDTTFTYNEMLRELIVEGNIPVGVTVQYINNKGTEVGTYQATAVLSGKNYNMLELTATLKINPDFTGMAFDVLSKLFVLPEMWEFLPESFAIENRLYNGAEQIDFNSNFVSVNSIPQMGFGKQMNVVYENLLQMQSVMKHLNGFYNYSNIIIDAYQLFLNDGPNNYKLFEHQTENFNIKLELTDNSNILLASYGTVAIEIGYNIADGIASGRIQLSDSNVIRYDISENELKIALSIFGIAVSQVEFIAGQQGVTGYFYEFYGTAENNLKTTALIKVDENYTTIISNKREIDDLIIEGYLETYDNLTGKFIGAEVKETNNMVDFDTLWFNLYDIEGFNSIKKVDEMNGLNLDTIYINNSLNPFKAKRNNLGFGSRQYDIEMKDMYFYAYDEINDSYSKIKMEIPMFFVQKANLGDYEVTAYNENENNGLTTFLNNTLTQAEQNAITENYTNLVGEFIIRKEQTTRNEIINYIGEKNSYFV